MAGHHESRLTSETHGHYFYPIHTQGLKTKFVKWTLMRMEREASVLIQVKHLVFIYDNTMDKKLTNDNTISEKKYIIYRYLYIVDL